MVDWSFAALSRLRTDAPFVRWTLLFAWSLISETDIESVETKVVIPFGSTEEVGAVVEVVVTATMLYVPASVQ